MSKLKNGQRVTEIKTSPKEQAASLLTWFQNHDVRYFDVQVRRYHQHGEEWITMHHDLIAEKVISFWLWLRRENAMGADIYFRPSSQRSHPVVFLDDLTLEQAFATSNKYACAVIETSKGNTQVWMSTSRILDRDERKQVQAQLIKLGYGDPGSVSGDHLGRLCGFKSQKNKCWVNAKRFSTPHGYPVPLNCAKLISRGGGGACALPREGSEHHSPSEREFGWATGMIRAGRSVNFVQEKLAEISAARGKRNPEQYASLTANKAAKVCAQVARE